MGITSAVRDRGDFEHEYLELMQRVFDQTCLVQGILPEDPEAEVLAAQIVRLVSRGNVDEDFLCLVLTKNY